MAARARQNPKIPKLSFVGGEISPDVGARVDLDLYTKSVQRAYNMIPQPFGGAYARPGTKFVDYAQDSAATPKVAQRITEFTFNSSQTYVIVWFDGFFRFYTDGAPVYDSSFEFVIDDIVDALAGVYQEIETTADTGLGQFDTFVVLNSVQHQLNGRELFITNSPSGGAPYELRVAEPSAGRTQGGGGTVTRHYQVAHGYSLADIPYIRFTQSNDTVYLTHPDYPPAKLVRGTAHDDWSLTNVAFGPSSDVPGGAFVQQVNTATTPNGYTYTEYAVTRVNFAGSESQPVYPDDPIAFGCALGVEDVRADLFAGIPEYYKFICTGLLGSTYTNPPKVLVSGGPVGVGSIPDHLFASGDEVILHGVTANDDSYLTLAEGLTTIITFDTGLLWDLDDLDFSSMSGSDWIGGWITKKSEYDAVIDQIEDTAFYRIYRRGDAEAGEGIDTDSIDGELWGLLTEVPGWRWNQDRTQRIRREPLLYSDRNQIGVDLTRTPPQLTNVFATTDQYPIAVEFFEQRLLFGGSNNDPIVLNASRSAVFEDFEVPTFVTDDGPLFLRVGGRHNEEIRHLVSARELIVLTAGGEATVVKPGEPMIPGTLAPKIHTTYGSEHYRPVQVGGEVLFVQSGAKRVRDLQYSLNQDALVSGDLSLLAHHIFDDNPIAGDLAFTDVPIPIVWAPLEDGTLAAMTYIKEQEVWGWSQHGFENGEIKSVCAIRESGENYDALYMLVDREIDGETVRYLERFQPPMTTVTEFEDAWCLDCALDAGENSSAGVAETIDNGDGTYSIVFASADAFSVSAIVTVENATEFGLADGTYQLGSSWEDGATHKQIGIIQYTGFPAPSCTSSGTIPVGQGRRPQVRECFDTIEGLWHLRGEEVRIWGKFGYEQNNVSGTDGCIVTSLGELKTADDNFLPTSKAIVGLGKSWELKTLRLDLVPGNTIGRRFRTPKATINFLTSQRFKAGTDGDYMRVLSGWEAMGPSVDTGEIGQSGEPKSGFIKTSIASSWDNAGEIVLTNEDSGPVRILSITPEIQLGD